MYENNTNDNDDNDYLSRIGNGIKNGLTTVYKGTVYTLAVYSLVFALAIFCAIGWMEFIGLNTGISEQLVPYWIGSALPTSVLLPVAELVRRYVSGDNTELLHEVDPENGDAGFKELYPKQWATLRVIDVVKVDGQHYIEVEKEKSDLWRITVDTSDGAKEGYECEFYDPVTNTAYVSFFGDVSGSEIRRHRHSAEYLKEEASAEKDMHQRLRNLYPDIVEAAVHDRLNYYIHIVEGEQVPGQKSIRSIINNKIQQSEIQDYYEDESHLDELIDMDNPFESEMTQREMIERLNKTEQSGENR